MNKTISDLEKIKSAGLSAVALTYGLGLVNWSIYSFNNSLGLVSAFDTQYFVGGFIPFLICSLIYFCFRLNVSNISGFKRKIKNKYRKLKELDQHGAISNFKKIGFRTGLFMIPVFWAYLVFIEKEIEILSIESLIFMIGLLLWILIFKVKPVRFITMDKILYMHKRRMARWYEDVGNFFLFCIKWTILSLAISAVTSYAWSIYPYIPQELGGARPRPCIFEYKRDLFSRETAAQICSDTANQVNRSRLVYVYLNSGDKILFKLVKDETASVYEIKKFDITNIEWF